MTTAAVVAYYKNDHQALISYAGHPPLLYKRMTDKFWSFAAPPNRKVGNDSPPMNLPFDVFPDTQYRQFGIPLSKGDRLFVYSDGTIEAPSPEGEIFGKDRLKNILDENGTTPLSKLKSKLIDALHKHTGNGLTHDDITLIALEIC